MHSHADGQIPKFGLPRPSQIRVLMALTIRSHLTKYGRPVPSTRYPRIRGRGDGNAQGTVSYEHAIKSLSRGWRHRISGGRRLHDPRRQPAWRKYFDPRSGARHGRKPRWRRRPRGRLFHARRTHVDHRQLRMHLGSLQIDSLAESRGQDGIRRNRGVQSSSTSRIRWRGWWTAVARRFRSLRWGSPCRTASNC